MDMIRSEAMRSANDAVPKTLQPFRYVLVPTFDAHRSDNELIMWDILCAVLTTRLHQHRVKANPDAQRIVVSHHMAMAEMRKPTNTLWRFVKGNMNNKLWDHVKAFRTVCREGAVAGAIVLPEELACNIAVLINDKVVGIEIKASV